jgi:hypothetical protein
MIPKWRFALYTVLAATGLVFTFLGLVFVISFVLFLLTKYGVIYMPLFGFGALLHGLASIPLTLLLLGIILIITTEIAAKNFSFSFKRPVLVTVLLVITVATVAAWFVSLSPLHDSIRAYGRHGTMRNLMHVYDRPMPFSDENGETVERGKVIATSTSGFVLQRFDEGTTSVIIGENTRIFAPITISDDVFVFGVATSGILIAQDIRSSKGPFRQGHHATKTHRTQPGSTSSQDVK